MTFAAKQDRSYSLEGLKDIVTALEAAQHLPDSVHDASIKIWDDSSGTTLAEIWWDSELERWCADLDPSLDEPDSTD